MSTTIFLSTFRRFLHWSFLLFGGMFVFSLGSFAGLFWTADYEMSREMTRNILFGPVLPLFLAFYGVMPQVANSSGLKDGEYLSLIFTRPLSRSCYILSKWLSGSFFVLTVLILMGTIAICMSTIIGSAAGITVPNIFDAYTLTDAVLNSLSATATAVLIASFPRYIGLIFLMVLIYLNLGLAAVFGCTSFAVSPFLPGASKLFSALAAFLMSFFSMRVDSYHIINSASSPIAALIIYVSNVVIYLTCATAVLCRREFFYAND
jgi:hypothetical protein